MPHTAIGNGVSTTTAVPYKNDLSLSNEILGNDVQAASLTHENVHQGRSFKGMQENLLVQNRYLN